MNNRLIELLASHPQNQLMQAIQMGEPINALQFQPNPAPDQDPRGLRGMTDLWYDRLIGDPLQGAANIGDQILGKVPYQGDEANAVNAVTALLGYAGPGVVKGKPMMSSVSALGYHGTPHKWLPEPGFPHGRPRLDKIGTGEGTAAYGYGVYLAEMEKYASQYADADHMAGLRSDWNATITGVWRKKAEENGKPRQWAILNTPVKEADGSWSKRSIEKSKEIGVDLEALSDEFADKASLYQLDIPDEILPKLLDWDRPLKDQSDYVKSRLPKKALESGADLTGGEWYEKITQHPGFQKNTSEFLKSLGIPGNTHGGVSKGATGAKYVIWDQDVLDRIALLERNGEKLQAMSAGADPTDPSILESIAPLAVPAAIAPILMKSHGRQYQTKDGGKVIYKKQYPES